ncbi:MAG: hypothetical protein KAQ74_01320, partial [Dehalococcoidia bacterium]|nr:hypothetical protein [Dehalococcoidia bacterium]
MDAQESDALVFHVDPSTVRERFEVGLLFEHLGAVLDALGSEDFVATRDGLRKMDIDRANLPSSLIDVCNRYVELCDLLSETTESLSVAIEECDKSLEANDLTRAGLSLGISRSLLECAREQLASLERATDEAFAILRRSGQGGSSSQLEQSRQTIDSAIERISHLAFEYERRLEEAHLRATDKGELWQPDLTMYVRDDAAWVGDEIVLSGVLSVHGDSVAGREIVLLLDGAVAGYVETDSVGAFTLTVILPFDYVPSHVVRASFQPTGDDLGYYGAAMSDDCVVTVRYHTSTVTVFVPPQMYPGLGATVAGRVASSGVTEGREVRVLVGNDVVGTRRTGPEGDFRIDFTLAEDAVEKEVPVEAVVMADDSA